MLARFAIAVGFALAPAGGLAAQSPGPAPERPRVGLVLSGGGARGIAHVGVLQVLEELRVPVDVVAGTSMGAIVGGLYAYGLSPDDLRAATVRDGAARDWAFLLRDGGDRADRPMRRKQEDRGYWTRMRLGLRVRDVEQRDARALARELARRHLADALGRAGDRHRAPRQFRIHRHVASRAAPAGAGRRRGRRRPLARPV